MFPFSGSRPLLAPFLSVPVHAPSNHLPSQTSHTSHPPTLNGAMATLLISHHTPSPQDAEARGDFAKAAEERALAQEAQAEAELAEEDLADAVAAEQEIAEMSLRERLDPGLVVEKIGQYGPNVR